MRVFGHICGATCLALATTASALAGSVVYATTGQGMFTLNGYAAVPR